MKILLLEDDYSYRNSIKEYLNSLNFEVDDLSTGYEIGCNDYIRKPFVLKELKYRVNQTINSFHFKTSKSKIRLPENFIFDLDKYELFHNENNIKLTSIEQKIFIFLIKRIGSYTTLADMISSIWDSEFISDADLRMHIKRIRDKSSKTLIQNSRGLGYKIEKI